VELTTRFAQKIAFNNLRRDIFDAINYH